ncbi:MAG: hypothetical protein AYK18_09625 [Theionarchaea archaeon DG-70]|nr:MAG: hypothetical protein AYK18_09625 [Theionarchaea archaeon DG-70]
MSLSHHCIYCILMKRIPFHCINYLTSRYALKYTNIIKIYLIIIKKYLKYISTEKFINEKY